MLCIKFDIHFYSIKQAGNLRYAIKCLCCFSGQCQTALGMESGAIPDDAITASSSYKEGSVGPESARSVVEFMYLIHVIHVIVCVRLHVDTM